MYRPDAGDGNFEVNFAPLGGTPVTMPGFKYRHFFSQRSAFRLGLFVGYQNENTVTQEENTNDDGEVTALELFDRMNMFTVNLQPGYEKHMEGTDRLSPYVGAFANIGYTSETMIEEMEFPIGASDDPDLFAGEDKTTTSTLNLGLNLVAGADYYFAKKAYLGVEIGFGFAMNMDLQSKSEMTSTELNDGGDTFIEVTDETEGNLNNTNTTQIGPNVVGQIRLGWLF